MIYLIVGLDRETLAPAPHIAARDATTAHRIAHHRAQRQGIDLIVAAAIGPRANVI